MSAAYSQCRGHGRGPVAPGPVPDREPLRRRGSSGRIPDRLADHRSRDERLHRGRTQGRARRTWRRERRRNRTRLELPERGAVSGLRLAHARGRRLVLRAGLAVSAASTSQWKKAGRPAGLAGADYPRLARRILLRSLGRAFTYPFLTIWRNRSLIRSMVRRDIVGRYRGSFGGVFWTVLNPLLLMLTYFFVFGIVLRTRFGGDPSRSAFVLYFLAGMLPWLPFSEAAGPRAVRHDGAPQLRQEAGLPPGDAAGEPDRGRPGDAGLRPGLFSDPAARARRRHVPSPLCGCRRCSCRRCCSRWACAGFWRRSASTCATWARSTDSC